MRLALCELRAGIGLQHLSLHRQQVGLGPFAARVQRTDTLVHIHRVHFTEQLTSLDRVARLHQHGLDPTRRNRPDSVRELGIDSSDAEQGGADGTLFDRDHTHGHRANGPVRSAT